MHSSRMRTAHLLTVCQHAFLGGGGTCSGGCTYQGEVPAQRGEVPAWRGVPAQWGVPGLGVYLPGGCTFLGGICPGTPTLWTEWQTGAKILPFPKLRLRAVITRLRHRIVHVKLSLTLVMNQILSLFTYLSTTKLLISNSHIWIQCRV